MEVIYHWNLNVIWYQLNILTKGGLVSYKYLVEKALKLRQNTFHAYIEHGEAHFGGDFSMIEMLKLPQICYKNIIILLYWELIREIELNGKQIQ